MYRVRFKRPDGTEAWLGAAGCGATEDPDKAPQISKREAELSAAERNVYHGPLGFRYWIVPVKTGEPK